MLGYNTVDNASALVWNMLSTHCQCAAWMLGYNTVDTVDCGSNEKDITESIPCGYSIVITCKKFLQEENTSKIDNSQVFVVCN